MGHRDLPGQLLHLDSSLPAAVLVLLAASGSGTPPLVAGLSRIPGLYNRPLNPQP